MLLMIKKYYIYIKKIAKLRMAYYACLSTLRENMDFKLIIQLIIHVLCI